MIDYGNYLSTEWWNWWKNATWNELVTVLVEKKKYSHDYQEKISTLEEEIKKVHNIIIDYTWQWVEYQELYSTKKNILNQLDEEYKQLQREQMTTEEQAEYIRKEKEFANMRKEFFWSMGFDQQWARWSFESEEEFFEYQKEENKKKKNAHHTKQNVSDIIWLLADQLRDINIKDLWRKIAFLLHPDRLVHDTEINNDKDYLTYCEELFKTLQSLYEKEDIWSMIMTLQDAGIDYKDWKLVLPFKEERSQIQQKSQFHKKRQELQEHLSVLKQSYIYIFYLKLSTWDIEKELHELDEKIQELEDLIVSYQSVHNE